MDPGPNRPTWQARAPAVCLNSDEVTNRSCRLAEVLAQDRTAKRSVRVVLQVPSLVMSAFFTADTEIKLLRGAET